MHGLPLNIETQIDRISYLHDPNYPRPIRCNNPGKVKKCNYKFIGKIKAKDRHDRSFEEFEFYHQGIQAMVEILANYYFDFDCKTPEKLINKYTEITGRPEGYVFDICKAAGFKARTKFKWTRKNVYLLVFEMCRINCGMNPLITSDLFAYVWLNIPTNE
jgi:hypothetical protein